MHLRRHRDRRDSTVKFYLSFWDDHEGFKGVDLTTVTANMALAACSISGLRTISTYSRHIVTQVFRLVLMSHEVPWNLPMLNSAHLSFGANGPLVPQGFEFKFGCLDDECGCLRVEEGNHQRTAGGRL